MAAKILMDGSNVLFWRGGHVAPQMPEMVAKTLRARRFDPVIYFDNSIGRHMPQGLLDLLDDQFEMIITPRGTQADELLLDACALGRCQIVSNDRFRGWRELHPQLRMDWLVTGSVGKGGRVSFSKKLRPAPL